MSERKSVEQHVEAPENLEVEKEKLLAEIEAALIKDPYSEESRFALIRVMGYSLSDALEIGKKVGDVLPDVELLSFAGGISSFPLYHRIHWLYFRQKIFFDELRQKFPFQLDKVKPIFNLVTSPQVELFQKEKIFVESVTDLEKKVDAFYVKVLPHRIEEKHVREDSVRTNEKRPDVPRTPTFKKAEATMERSKIFLEDHYYTGDFRNEIFGPEIIGLKTSPDELKEIVESFNLPPGDEDIKVKLLTSSHISRTDVDRCFSIFGVEQTSDITKMLEKIKYRPDIVDVRMIELAKRDLQKEIRDKIPLGYVLEKDATGEWKIVVDQDYQLEKTVEAEQSGESFFDFEKWEKTECLVPDNIKDNVRVILRKRKEGFYTELYGTNGSYDLKKNGQLVTSENDIVSYFYSRTSEAKMKCIHVPGEWDDQYSITVKFDSGNVVSYKAEGIVRACRVGDQESRDSLYFCDLDPHGGTVAFVEVTSTGDLKKTVIYDRGSTNHEYPSEVYFLDEQTVAICIDTDSSPQKAQVVFYSLKTSPPTRLFGSKYYDLIRKLGSGIVCEDTFLQQKKDFFIRDIFDDQERIQSYEDISDIERIADLETLKFGYKIRKKDGTLIVVNSYGKGVSNTSWAQIENSSLERIIGEGFDSTVLDIVDFSQFENRENEVICKSDSTGTKVYKFPLWETAKPLFTWNGEHLFELTDVSGDAAVAIDENTFYPGFRYIDRSQTEVCLVFYNKTMRKVSMYWRNLIPNENAKSLLPEEYVPNFWDLRNLELLNAFEIKEKAVQYIEKYLSSKTYEETLRQKVANIFSQPDKKRTLELAAKHNPDDFFPQMSIGFDWSADIPWPQRHRATDVFLQTFFPQYYHSVDISKKRIGGGKPEGYLNPNQRERTITDGDPEQKHPPIIFTSRKKVTGFYPRAFLAAYNGYSQTWRESNLEFSTEYEARREQHTYTLSIPKKLKEVILPISEGGELLSERVVGIRKKMDGSSEEVRMYPVKSKSGIWSVGVPRIPRGVTQIVYSELSLTDAYHERQPVVTNQNEYKKGIVSEVGDDLTADIFDTIPLNWTQFLNSLQGKSVEEKVAAVENFAQSIFYYDFQNKQVMGLKDKLTPSERVKFMKERLSVLVQREKNNGKKKKLEKKQLAGVCADFTIITTGLLRRLGVPAGIVQGFLVKDTDTITAKDSHTVVFVPLPSKKRGKYRPVLVETTPSGLTSEEEEKLQEIRVNYKILGEQDKHEREEKEIKKLEAQLLELQKIYTEEKVLDILALQNGTLENALNTILQVGVKKHHTKIFESIFSLARYGGIDINDTTVISDVAQKLIEEERTQKDETDESSDGTHLMHVFQEYIFRYSRDAEKSGETKTKAREHAFSTLQKIVLAVSPHLEQLEKMAALVVLSDLKAKGMSTFARPAKES